MKQLRRFLGMTNFYRRFIPGCAETLQPLNKNLSPAKNNKKKLKWSVEAVLAFLKIKQTLSSATLLTFPTPNSETAIFMDASVSGCGAVLHQRTPNRVLQQSSPSGAWKPLSFYYPSFSLTQSRYSMVDRELFAIYLAITHFRYFIEDRIFTVFTCHAPLCKAIFSRSQNFSPTQQRRLDFIAQFTSNLHYVKGEKNVVADCLSRITASIFEENEAINF